MPNIRDLKLGPITINEFDYSTTFINEIDYGAKTVFLNGGGPQPGFGNILVADANPRSSAGGFHIEVSPGTYPNSYNPGTWVTLQSYEADITSIVRLLSYWGEYTSEPNIDGTRGSVHLLMSNSFNYYLGYIFGKNTPVAEAVEYWEQYTNIGTVSWAVRLGETPATHIPGAGKHMRLDLLIDPESYVTNETTNQSASDIWNCFTLSFANTSYPNTYSGTANFKYGFPVIKNDGSVIQGSIPSRSDNIGDCLTNETYTPEVTNEQVTSAHYDYYLLNGEVPTQETLSAAVAATVQSGDTGVALESQLIAGMYGAYSNFDETITGNATIKIKKHTTSIWDGLQNSLLVGGLQNYTDVVESCTFNDSPDLDTDAYITSAIENDVTVVVNRSRTQPTGYAPSDAPVYEGETRVGYLVDAPFITNPLGSWYGETTAAAFSIRKGEIGLRYHISADNICTYVDIIKYDEENQDITERDEQNNVLYSLIHSPKLLTVYYKDWEKEYNQ